MATMDEASRMVGWQEQMSDDQTEVLRDYGQVAEVGGDAEDWIGAVIVHVLAEDLTVGGVTVPAGTYVRAVDGKREESWRVADTTAAIDFVQLFDAVYIAGTPMAMVDVLPAPDQY